jgi:hypothetical protein
MRLNVPYIRQEKKTCGPSSLQQVLNYYGDPTSLSEILANVKMFPSGTPPSYLALGAKKLGYKTKLISFDVDYVDPSWKNASKKEIAEKLRKRLPTLKDKSAKMRTRGLLTALKGGVDLEIQIPSEKILIGYLKGGIPPIITLSYNVLHNYKRKFNDKQDDVKGHPSGHYVVVSGYDDKNLIITDPSRRLGGTLKVPKEKLIFSWFFRGGWILIVEPKKIKVVKR